MSVNASTMLGQSKTCYQAEIDAACELADFWRFNVALRAGDPHRAAGQSAPGVWNRTDHRPLEGFVLAITPFNFTSIAGDLPDRARPHGRADGLEAVGHPGVLAGTHVDAPAGGGPDCRQG